VRKNDRILLGHGSGGRLSHSLVADLLLKNFDNQALAAMNDQAIVSIGAERIAFSTDTYVIDPPFFPGGDIGSLAVHGTVNDLAVGGAEPLYLSFALILEEGFPLDDLERIVESAAGAARKAGVQIVTGDTKVVGKGAADKIYINTAGVGRILPGVNLSGANVRPGDTLVVSGTMGDHGLAVIAKRRELSLNLDLVSDSASLNRMVLQAVAEVPGIHAMRDPTRGGLATVCAEWSRQSGVGIELFEESVPISPGVAGACELLGFDPLYVANEGKVLVAVAPEGANQVVEIFRSHPEGREAAIVGRVVEAPHRVWLRTRIGGKRLVDMLEADQLPRIC
jgi:hydrogenase expression/formation protein HypE